MKRDEMGHAGEEPVFSDELIRLLTHSRLQFRRFLRKHISDEAVADDLLQQATLKALRNDRDGEVKDSMVAWFYRILRNVLTDHYRSRAAEGRKSEALAQSGGLPESITEMDKARLCSCFRELLPALKPEYADLIRRIDLEEEGQARVAEDLGLSANTLSVRLHRARQSLRTNLERTCGLCTKHGCLDCTCGHP